MNHVHTHCILCSSTELKPLSRYYEQHSLIKCGNCSLVFAEKIPSIEELNSHYSAYSYDNHATISTSTLKSYSDLLDEMEPFRSNNRLLDTGCGRGWFLVEAKKRGWEVYGTEYSDKAVELCEKNGINMKHGQLNAALFEAGYFDVITSFEVIEHINNPLEDLAYISSFLRSGGLFYCTTPNFNSIMRYYLKEKYNVIEYPEHLTYYTKKTLSAAIEKSAFRKMKFLSTGISVTRIQQSLGNTDKVHDASSDEKLREKIGKKWYLNATKKILNTLFTWTNTGLTLKAYYIKK